MVSHKWGLGFWALGFRVYNKLPLRYLEGGSIKALVVGSWVV